VSGEAGLEIDIAVDLPGGPPADAPTTIAACLRIPLAAGVTVLFGPSGCGKTTILRCLAGLTRPSRGRVAYGAECWSDAATGTCLPPHTRDVSMLPQDLALFPWLDVAANVDFGVARLPAEERRRRVREMLECFEIDELVGRKPTTLSGGQQQRVALARALARPCRLLLLDEPLSALDGEARGRLRPRLREALLGTGVPAVVVTHDAGEAREIGDTIVLMERGRVIRSGRAEELLPRPPEATIRRAGAHAPGH